jgi:hypothetical protein
MTHKEYETWIIVDKNGNIAFDFAYSKKESAQSFADFVNDVNNAKTFENKPVCVHRAKLILQNE